MIRHLTVMPSQYPEHTLFPMPALSPTMESGTIGSWAIAEGDSFAAGDVLCSIETDKASVDFEAQDDGILAKIIIPPGKECKIGTPICVVVADAEDVPAFANFKVNKPSASSLTTPEPVLTSTAVAAATSATMIPAASAESPPAILFPSARHLAESHRKDATGLRGSGKGGRVTKADVMEALSSLPDLAVQQTTKQTPTPPPAAAAVGVPTAAAAAAAASSAPTSIPIIVPLPTCVAQEYHDVSNNKMRKIIASRLTESKQTVPHSYTSVEIELDEILKLRKLFAKQHEIKISVNDFVLRSCALALRDVPQVNGYFHKDDGSVRSKDSIDISVAVATPTGLITPIVFAADTLGLSDISKSVLALASRARAGTLAPHEYQGGSFSVSNLGMFGIAEFSAVINPPQAAILAVGGGIPTIVPTLYDENKSVPDDEAPPVVVRTVMTARLSADRRVVDEATSALFLQALQRYMQQPELLLL
jgi:pyruvate dehydrogenase E2 component (dihydrolipoamide acetyltransferase)